MTAKRRKARRPEPLVWADHQFAHAEHGAVVVDAMAMLDHATVSEMIKWLTRAAAWMRAQEQKEKKG